MNPVKQHRKIPVCVSVKKRPGQSRWRSTISGRQVHSKPTGHLHPTVAPSRLKQARANRATGKTNQASHKMEAKAKGNSRETVKVAMAKLRTKGSKGPRKAALTQQVPMTPTNPNRTTMQMKSARQEFLKVHWTS